ncbi:MAG: long-chain fatty acid--CoA ligase [Dehalococcoidia bacterium]|nr:long-chain fatty acid--CoA ligase [Dehalococcoidia bacterium]
MTLVDYVDKAEKEKPKGDMLIFKKRHMSYAEVNKLSDEFAAALVSLGVKKGDRVALVMANCPQAIICRWGAWKVGAILVHLNPVYTDAEMEHALKDCSAETVVVLTPFYQNIKKLQSRTSIKNIIATNIKEYLPPILKILFTLAKEKKEGHYVVIEKEDIWLQDLMAKFAGARRPDVKVTPEDPALLLFSGGTTGLPKGVIGSHFAQVATGMQFHAWVKNYVEPYKDVVIAVLPLFHSFGTFAVMCTSIVANMALALVPNPRDRDDIVATIKYSKPAFFVAVPALFIALMENDKVKAGKVDFRSMKTCCSGAAPLMAETKKRFEELTGGRILEGYALTETTMAACVGPYKGQYKEGSVGLPLPDVAVRIGDIETGEGELPPGQEGEIVFSAPNLMLGYFNRPEETKEMLRDGWLYTGDVGYMDQDGYVFITSRKKDLIKPSGFQVWPREVEEVINAHPAVAEVSVAGIPDAKQGEAVKAWVVLNAGMTVTQEEIQAWCREKLVAYKVPKFVEFRSELPKTMVGKVLRRVLVEEETKKGD